MKLRTISLKQSNILIGRTVNLFVNVNESSTFAETTSEPNPLAQLNVPWEVLRREQTSSESGNFNR